MSFRNRKEALQRALNFTINKGPSKFLVAERAFRLPEPVKSSEQSDNVLFPSKDRINEISKLAKVTTQATELAGKSVDQIITFAQEYMLRAGKPVVIGVGVGGFLPEQDAALEEAKQKGAPIEIVREIKPESEVINNIVTDFLGNPHAREILKKYLSLVPSDLLRIEYEDFAVGQNKDLSRVLDVHYLKNLGLETDEQLEEQAQVHELVEDVLREHSLYRKLAAAIPNDAHPRLFIGQKVHILALGMLSNLLRGGIFYGYRERINEVGNYEPMKYKPREIAFQLIDELRKEQQREEQLASKGRRELK